MASTTQKNPSSAAPSSPADEARWVIQIRALVEEEIKEDDMRTPVSIFCVPQPMVSFRPHAYAPQLFAFGPYHHWQPRLYDMERYKLAAARRMQQERLRGGGLGFEDVVGEFEKREFKIRCHYHKYLDLGAKTLAWMMAIDTSFLLNFLQNNYSGNKPQPLQDTPARTLSKMAAKESVKLGNNMLRRDILMLENQIPFFLLKKLNHLLYPSKQSAREQLSKLLAAFVKDTSPFKALIVQNGNNASYAHLLDLLYRSVVPEIKQAPVTDPAQQNIHTGPDRMAQSQPRTVWNGLWKFMSGISPRPIKFVLKLPWKLITSLLPIMPKLESILINSTDQPSTVEEIAIPSVREISGAGVHFKPADGDMSTIRFDRKTLTIFLPTVIIDETTDVLLRNLVAYETIAVNGPMVFTRYVELMCGMIDTAEDVKILRAVGVVENRMKSEEEAAEMWNGMSRSVRMRRVGFLDRVIRDVNKYYESVWRVKARVLMRKYVLGSWQVLTFLGAVLLLVLTCVQTFCSVYSCSAHLAEITNVGGD